MNKLYLDTETCGLHGMPVLLQYAVNDGPVSLYEPWKMPVGETLDLIEWMLTHTIVYFNAVFDHYHLAKLYTIWLLLPREWIPEEHIDEIASRERAAQDGPCIKPAGCLDLMLHARKGPYQSLMNRDPIRIRRVPAQMAQPLAAYLESKVTLDKIYDARCKKPGPRWKIFDTHDPKLKNIVRRFSPSGALKHLAEHALKIEKPTFFSEVELDKRFRPVEFGYAPTADAVSIAALGWKTEIKQSGNPSGLAWPGVIKKHIEHWHCNQAARQYARDDVEYTRGLDKHFGYPTPNDDDSVLACMVAVIRWHGLAIDKEGIQSLLDKAQAVWDDSPINVNRVKEVREYLEEVMTPMEASFISETTGKDKLEKIEKQVGRLWRRIDEREECDQCQPGAHCKRCNGTGWLEVGPHPAWGRAKQVMAVKRAKKEIELYKKLLLAGKLHADFVIIGAKSSRMSGAGGVNAQAIKRALSIRQAFPLAWPGMVLCGGDFASFEVTIADAVYQDPELRKELLSGQKIHALFGMTVYNLSYEELVANKDLYTRAKIGVFLDMYGGQAKLLAEKLDITEEAAAAAQKRWQARFPGIGEARKRNAAIFGCISQPGGSGTAVYWGNPKETSSTLFGFQRYFTVEHLMAHALFDLARDSGQLQRLCDSEEMVKRYEKGDRWQTVCGATASALYGSVQVISEGVIRAGGNNEIQGTGAEATKRLQRRIWDHQPIGVHPFRVAPMNVHDEIMCPTLPGYIEAVAETVRETVEGFRSIVPLIGIEWYRQLDNWGSKDGIGASGLLKVVPK